MRTLTIILTIVLAMGFSVAGANNPAEIAAGAMTLKFASDGKPKSFMIAGREMLDEANPGAGFELQGFGFNWLRPVAFAMKEVTYDGKHLVASAGNYARVTCEVQVVDDAMLLRIVRVEGVPKQNRLGLSFTMNLKEGVKVIPLDPLTITGSKGCQISWPWLWQRTDNAPMGGFALYASTDAAGEVAQCLRVWAAAGVVVPDDASANAVDNVLKGFATAQVKLADPRLPELRAPAPAGQTFEISSKALSLRFGADAKPISFMIGEQELLSKDKAGPGFEIVGYDQGEIFTIPAGSMRYENGRLTAFWGQRASATFDVKSAERYLVFKPVRIDGLPADLLLCLRFTINVDGKRAKTLPLDYLASSNSQICGVSWLWPWARKNYPQMGGFAIYAPSTPEDEDETLLHLWANEGLPHPRVSGTWDVETARTWLKNWQAKFLDQSQLLISAETNEELYTLADYAKTLDVKRIKMHTDTWRGEYWPKKYSFLHLNPKTFPQGEADFQKFADYAASQGMGLTIHTVSCSIANEDPDYIVGKIDPRLAKWIEGTLAKPASSSDKTLYFKPALGAEMPLNIGRSVTGPAHVDPWNKITTVRIGDEFVRVGTFIDTDKDVWVLEGCRRGQFTTTVAEHPINAVAIGLIRPYDQVFAADNDSTLVEELAKRIAEFSNRNNIIHCTQDAGEVHTVNHKWGYAKFAQTVYSHLDHPVTSNNSSGTPMPCQLEYLFNSSKNAVASRKYPNVPLTVVRNGRASTTPYEMFSLVGKRMATGVTGIGLSKPEPMFGVSSMTVQNHGLAPYAAETVLAWKGAAPLLNDEQRKTILESSEFVIFRAAKTAAGFSVTPLRMLYRPAIDIGWREGSENGPIVPRHYVRVNDTLAVENPYQAQEPEFLIRVMNAFSEGADAKALKKSAAGAAGKHDDEDLEGYNIGAGMQREEHPLPNIDPAIKTVVQPVSKSIRNVGDHQFSDDAGVLRIRFENKRKEKLTQDTNLPYFDCSADMTAARGIGLTVTGDGSGAVLVIQPSFRGQRDYIVVIDFTGPREIVIPCGEVSWSDARWGWYMRTKGSQYGKVNRMAIGLGVIPPQTTVDIQVSNLRVLPEIATALKNPVIKIGPGTLQILGTIESESLLWYQGGATIGVYDLNWNKLADLPVKKQDFIAPQGLLEFSVESSEATLLPWLECQFFVKDVAMSVPAL